MSFNSHETKDRLKEWPSQVSKNMLVYSQVFTPHGYTQRVDMYTARL